jgi:hypothetical protein
VRSPFVACVVNVFGISMLTAGVFSALAVFVPPAPAEILAANKITAVSTTVDRNLKSPW